MKTSKLYVIILLLVASCAKDDPKPTPLTIESFSPTSAAVGSQIQIIGTGFSSVPTDNNVQFNGVKAQVLTNPSSTSLTVTVPISTSGKITVQVGSQTVTSSDDFMYLTPTIKSFDPVAAGPGANVRIFGSNFSTTLSDNIVKINGVKATISATNPSASELNVAVPAGCESGYITVQIGDMVTTSATEFFYRKPVTVSTLAGGQVGYADGTNAVARFNGPAGVAVDADGFVYVAESRNHTIRKVAPNGTAVTLAGSGSAGNLNGNWTSAKFNAPYGVALDAAGNVYVADTFNHSIRKITPSGDVTTLAGSGVAGYSNGNGVSAQFNTPYGVGVDINGNIYVGEQDRIRKINKMGDVTTFAEGLGAVIGLALDKDGNIFVTDSQGDEVKKITTSGNISSVRKFDSISNLGGITVDKDGSLIIADFRLFVIWKITPRGTMGFYAGGTCAGTKNGPGESACFESPFGVAFDKQGTLYVGDGVIQSSGGNILNTIRKITVN